MGGTIRCAKLRENQVRLFAGAGMCLRRHRWVSGAKRASNFLPFERFWIALRSEDEHSIHPLAEEFARRYREKGYWQDLPLTEF